MNPASATAAYVTAAAWPLETMRRSRSGRSRCSWRPQRVVELVEGDDRALRHPRHEMLERHLRRLVQVEVHEEQAHHEVGVVGDEGRNRLRGVALDELDLRDVAEEAVLVVQLDELQ